MAPQRTASDDDARYVGYLQVRAYIGRQDELLDAS
jgi:hypothetical protein